MAKLELPFIDINAGKWFTEAEYQDALKSGILQKTDLIYFRSSMVGDLMSYAEKPVIPDGAYSKLDKIANRIIFKTEPKLDTFAIEKGRTCEDLGIDLYNDVKCKFLVKNKVRMYYWHPMAGVILTGECDLHDADLSKTIDIKLAYSTESMPITLKNGNKKLYEWQLDCYNILNKTEYSELAYCMITTPEHLIKKGDPESWHLVDHIDEKYRLTTMDRQRDTMRINQIINRLILCKRYVLNLLDELGFDLNDIKQVAEAEEE